MRRRKSTGVGIQHLEERNKEVGSPPLFDRTDGTVMVKDGFSCSTSSHHPHRSSIPGNKFQITIIIK